MKTKRLIFIIRLGKDKPLSRKQTQDMSRHFTKQEWQMTNKQESMFTVTSGQEKWDTVLHTSNSQRQKENTQEPTCGYRLSYSMYKIINLHNFLEVYYVKNLHLEQVNVLLGIYHTVSIYQLINDFYLCFSNNTQKTKKDDAVKVLHSVCQQIWATELNWRVYIYNKVSIPFSLV